MPPHIYTEGLPEEPTPIPAWGALPLDLYLLVCTFSPNVPCTVKLINISKEQWDTPYPDSPNELSNQRRERLVRQWLNIGTMGREVSFDCQLFATLSYLLSISLLILL
jgi:hypothetical protein